MRNRVEDNHESAGGFLEPPFILRHDIDTAAAMLPVLLVLATIAPTREKRKTFIVHFSVKTKQSLAMWSYKTIWCQLMDKKLRFTLFTLTPRKELIFRERQKSFNLVRPSACRRWLQLDLVKSWWGFERRWSVAGIGLGTSQKFMARRLSLDTPSYPTIPSLTWTSTTTSTGCLWPLERSKAQAFRGKSFGQEPSSLATSHQPRRATPGKSK